VRRGRGVQSGVRRRVHRFLVFCGLSPRPTAVGNRLNIASLKVVAASCSWLSIGNVADTVSEIGSGTETALTATNLRKVLFNLFLRLDTKMSHKMSRKVKRRRPEFT
jgi:hypothetical protein